MCDITSICPVFNAFCQPDRVRARCCLFCIPNQSFLLKIIEIILKKVDYFWILLKMKRLDEERAKVFFEKLAK